MKISNSKKELARIISENGGWRKGSYAAQDSVIRFFVGNKPKYNKKTKLWDAFGSGARIMAIGGTVMLPNRQRTTLSSSEYFSIYPAPDADGWIEWSGGECPVGAFDVIEVRYRDYFNEVNHIGESRVYDWVHHGSNTDIIAYRLHKQEKCKPEFCESVMRTIPELEVKPTIEQLAADYRNAKDYAERKQQEADAAKADADERLRVLEIAGEAHGLIVSPITVKQEPELMITNRSQLELGDVIWLSDSTVKENNELTPSGEYTVVKVGVIGVESDGQTIYPDFSTREWRFIRRP